MTGDKADRRITVEVRRDIAKVIRIFGKSIFGFLDPVDFLQEIFPLKDLPSTDSRYSNMVEDICQHVVYHDDWPLYWELTDERLALETCSDIVYLNFITKILSPDARENTDDIKWLALHINDQLKETGWTLYPRKEIAGWPVYDYKQSTENCNNQGRGHSKNPAQNEEDGLYFRSPAEILLYRELKSKGYTFAPLPVFIRGGRTYDRLEPDFVIIHHGRMLIIEVDGVKTHQESPFAAQKKLEILTDEGADVYRVQATKDADEAWAKQTRLEIERKLAIIKQIRR